MKSLQWQLPQGLGIDEWQASVLGKSFSADEATLSHLYGCFCLDDGFHGTFELVCGSPMIGLRGPNYDS